MPGFRPLVGNEFQRLQDACQGPWAAQERAFYALVGLNGLRPREALLLRFTDVCRGGPTGTRIVERMDPLADHRAGDPYLLKAFYDERRFVLCERVRAALQDWVETAVSMGVFKFRYPLIFHFGCRDVARSLNYLWRQFKETAARAGLEGNLSLHSLSKTFVLSYARRTNYAFAKVKKAAGYDTRRNARRAYNNAVQALQSNHLDFQPENRSVRGRLERGNSPSAETQALAHNAFSRFRTVCGSS